MQTVHTSTTFHSSLPGRAACPKPAGCSVPKVWWKTIATSPNIKLELVCIPSFLHICLGDTRRLLFYACHLCLCKVRLAPFLCLQGKSHRALCGEDEFMLSSSKVRLHADSMDHRLTAVRIHPFPQMSGRTVCGPRRQRNKALIPMRPGEISTREKNPRDKKAARGGGNTK